MCSRIIGFGTCGSRVCKHLPGLMVRNGGLVRKSGTGSHSSTSNPRKNTQRSVRVFIYVCL